jgi:glycosyltransferase involved in cell wall biosynthesis
MLISIVIPTLNRLRYLKKTIESVRSQSIRNYEIIVIDNASSDGTNIWLEEQKDIILIRQNTLIPIYQNWVAGLKRAKGDFVLLLSDDDLLCPHCLQRIQDIPDKMNYSMIIGRHDVIDENDNITQLNDKFVKYRSGIYSSRETLLLLSEGIMFRLCAIFFNRNILAQIDLEAWSNEYAITAADSELIQYMASKSSMYLLDQQEGVGLYRVWRNSATSEGMLTKEWQIDIDVWMEKFSSFSKNILTKKEIECSVNKIKFSNLIAAINTYKTSKLKSVEMSLFFFKRLTGLLFKQFDFIKLLKSIKYTLYLLF